VAAGQASASWSTWRVRLQRRRRLLVGAVLAALVLFIVAAVLFGLDVGDVRSRLTGATGATAHVVRLAVLPFANVSGDAAQEYLSDGLTTEMIALLGRLHPETLHVIARQTAMSYKKTDKAVDQIGRELGVDYVLEGSAQKDADRIRITADLIKVADQTQLWAERYERELAGILALQNDVAQQVAKALALKLLPVEQARLAGAKTVDAEVYDLCLKGTYFTDRLTKTDLDTGERYFQMALAKDPFSAYGHAGVAAVWGCRQQMGFAPASEAGPRAKAAALKAVKLDDTLARVHDTLAGVLAWTDFDWPGAEREYRRAIELDPADASSRRGYSHVLMILRRPEEAMAQINRAVDLDPLSVVTLSFYAIDLMCARRFDDAITQARAALVMQADEGVALTALLFSLHAKNRRDEVTATAAGIYAGPLFGWRDVGEALKRDYAKLGYTGALHAAADAEMAKHGSEPGTAFDAASNYVMTGDSARALDCLEQAYGQRDPNMPYVSCFPLYDPLRAEPRFQALLRQMNLPQ
jgi:TolB-like protein